MSHSLEKILGDSESLRSSRISARGPDGKLLLTPEMLREEPSERRRAVWAKLVEAGVDPNYMIMSLGTARREYLASTVISRKPHLDADTCTERQCGVNAENADFFSLYLRKSVFICVPVLFPIKSNA